MNNNQQKEIFEKLLDLMEQGLVKEVHIVKWANTKFYPFGCDLRLIDRNHTIQEFSFEGENSSDVHLFLDRVGKEIESEGTWFTSDNDVAFNPDF